MFVKIAALFCGLLLASACVTSGYKSIGYDREGASYNTSRMNFTSTGDDRGTCHVLVKSRPYEQTGMTHICGYIHDPEQGGCGGLASCRRTWIHAWFSGAKLILGGTVISSASFLEPEPVPAASPASRRSRLAPGISERYRAVQGRFHEPSILKTICVIPAEAGKSGTATNFPDEEYVQTKRISNSDDRTSNSEVLRIN